MQLMEYVTRRKQQIYFFLRYIRSLDLSFTRRTPNNTTKTPYQWQFSHIEIQVKYTTNHFNVARQWNRMRNVDCEALFLAG